MRTFAWPVQALLAGALLHVTASPTLAQASCVQRGIVAGVVRTELGVPVPRAELTVEGIAPVLSDSEGRFRIAGVCAGSAAVSARRLGYRAGTWHVDVRASETTAVELTIFASPYELAPVVVRAAGGTTRRLRDFYLRRHRGSGTFLTRDDLAPFEGRPVTDALRARVPGVQVYRGGGTIRNHVRLRGQRCAPMVWLDGMSTPAGEYDLDVIESSSIAGVEVYPGPSTIPAEFRTPFGREGCGGAIVIWTRVGLDEWDVDEPDPEPAREGPPLVVFEAADVDVPAAVDSSAFVAPFYPDSLRAFEVAGTVEASFVVDTTGRPLEGSVRIVKTSSAAFGDAVTRAIRYSRFFPARKDGRPVRQRMTLTFEFTTDRRS
ncbi:MAG TPA: TonB family protein [Gemmatimonadaceae bacterium]|nr:TonB family protein [Gemmatimonadaceae bacterium]